MFTEPTGLTTSQLAAGLQITEAAAEVLLTNQKWLEATLEVLAVDRFALKRTTDGKHTSEHDEPIAFVFVKGSICLYKAPKDTQFSDALFRAYAETLGGVLLARQDTFCFVPRGTLLEWIDAGSFRNGSMKVEKFDRLLKHVQQNEG